MNSTTKTGREGGTQILCSFCDKSSQEYYPRAGGKKSWHPECLAAYNRGEKNVRGGEWLRRKWGEADGLQ